ncbi:MAG: ExbD/TolR family protein [Trueperaceae bacterium]
MRSRRKRLDMSGIGIDLTPMVDVAFTLIMFFMVSMTFITSQSGMPVDLPQATTAAITSPETPSVTINSQNQVFLGNTQVAVENLEAQLKATLQQTGFSVVVLRADKNVLHGLSVQVMDIIKRAGAQRIAIATGS